MTIFSVDRIKSQQKDFLIVTLWNRNYQTKLQIAYKTQGKVVSFSTFRHLIDVREESESKLAKAIFQCLIVVPQRPITDHELT